MIVPIFAGCTDNDNSDPDNVYTLSVNYNDEISRPHSVDVIKGESVEKLAEPIRAGYNFAGWYTEAEDGTEITFPYKLTQNSAVYAHWTAGVYDITFDYNYEGSPEPVVKNIEYKNTVEAPASPERNGYVFRYWSSNAEGGKAEAFPYLVTKNITFYASWRDADINVYKVTLHYGDYEGAPADVNIEVEQGNRLTNSMIPAEKRSGYSLKGWATSAGSTEVITLPYTPTATQTLYAVWEKQTYSVAFRYNFTDCGPSNIYKTVQTNDEGKVEEPESPVREGYDFTGWYTTDNGGSRIEFPAEITRNTAYYAHWKSKPVTTDIFHAEYVEFDPNAVYPGYSGETLGAHCIAKRDVSGILTDNYPTNSKLPAGEGYYVSSQYNTGCTLVFNITASEDISNATLIANWAVEYVDENGVTFGPTGESAYAITINGQPLNYSPVTVKGANEGSGQFKCGFKEYVIASGISLKKGENVIALTTQNTNTIIGAAAKAIAPMTDYIRLDYGGGGKLSWRPEYDNLERMG